VNAGSMIGLSARLLFLGLTATSVVPDVLVAQVGITSGLAQVALVARSAPRGAIGRIGAQSERAVGGAIREFSVPVQVSANTAYRLLVIRTRPTGATSGPAVQVLVRAADGEFKALEAGSPVVVARGKHQAGERHHEIVYRLQANDHAPALPVRYEIAINPQL
jgi:hypothetical protein